MMLDLLSLWRLILVMTEPRVLSEELGLMVTLFKMSRATPEVFGVCGIKIGGLWMS